MDVVWFEHLAAISLGRVVGCRGKERRQDGRWDFVNAHEQCDLNPWLMILMGI